ncbi:MAG: FHA domain-containing protein [Polyangia bacterium]
MITATPPAGMPRVSISGSLPTPETASASAGPDALANTIGPAQVAPLLAAVGIARPTGGQNTVKADAFRAEPVAEEAIYATLVVVRRDGSDGDSVRIRSTAFDIGRTEGGLHFGEDIYLAERHARILFAAGKATLRPLDKVNGVYLRLRGAVELHPGDQFIVGKEVIRWEPVGPEEGDVFIVEHGVRLFGTVPREAWGRLRQLTASGTSRDVWHMSRPDLVLGREEGDITFPDDEFMSRRHAAVRRGTARPKLEDLNSSNGTFIRVRGDHELKSGDLLRLGDQLLRVEI